MVLCSIIRGMDLRILRYFLAVADEGNITRASERLHVSQPALSTQLAALEDELGQKLFERGARGIELTEKGVALKRRADDLVDLAERIEAEIKSKDSGELVGTLSIGAGETPVFRFVARAAKELRRAHPRLNFSVSSGNGEDILAHLREGTLDLGVLVGPGRYEGFDYLTLPYTHRWGLAVEKDSPLAANKHISPKDARAIPLLCSRQGMPCVANEWKLLYHHQLSQSFCVVMVVALEVGTKSKASSQRLSQLFAKSIEVVLGDCAFTQ